MSTNDIHNERQVNDWYGDTTGRRDQDNKRAAAGNKPLPDEITGGKGWSSHVAGHKDAIAPTYSEGLLRRDAKYNGNSGKTVVGSTAGASLTPIQKAEHERELRLQRDWYPAAQLDGPHQTGDGWYADHE